MRNHIKHRHSTLAACILGAPVAICAVPVFAQNATLEEIVVTAQRREESLQEVPIAIAAFSDDFLTQTGVVTTMDLGVVTPGLNYGAQLNGAVPFIRGIGNNGTTVGQDASVSTYVDDVYMSASAGSIMSLNNIERIEVLKGPQGTLFGRNATGGLIHIITRNPSRETSGNIEVSAGNYETMTGSFYGTTGITDNMAADLALYYSNQDDGWGKNLATGNDVYLGEETMVRTKWLIEASENTAITLSADVTDIDTSKGIAQRIGEGSLGIDGLLAFGFLTTPVAQGGAGLGPEQATPLAIAAATKAPDDYYDINSGIDPTDTMKNWGLSAKIVHQMGDMELTSITAYRDFDHSYYFNQFTIPATGLADITMPEYTETRTQEFRLSSSGDTLNWIVGTYILDEEAGFDSFRAEGALLAPLSALTVDSVQDTFSWAVFAQGGYALGPRTNLTIGVRYTEDEREISGSSAGLVGAVPVMSINYKDDETFREPTWRLAIDHSFSDNIMGYFSYNRGFKSGVYATVVTDLVNGPRPPVEPEILDAYEIGFKSDLLNGRMRLNGSAFYYQFDNLQATISEAGTAYLINAAEAIVKGGELELTALVTDNFQIHGGFSVLDAEYDSFPGGEFFVPTGIGGNTKVTGDLSGNTVVRSPEFTGNLGFSYDIPTDAGVYTTSMNYYYNDGFFWEQDNRIAQESYALLNGQITWKNPSEDVYVQVFGNNLTDEEYAQFVISAVGGDQLTAAAPRTYGVKIGFNF